jgi:hypothetical protein
VTTTKKIKDKLFVHLKKILKIQLHTNVKVKIDDDSHANVTSLLLINTRLIISFKIKHTVKNFKNEKK